MADVAIIGTCVAICIFLGVVGWAVLGIASSAAEAVGLLSQLLNEASNYQDET